MKLIVNLKISFFEWGQVNLDKTVQTMFVVRTKHFKVQLFHQTQLKKDKRMG